MSEFIFWAYSFGCTMYIYMSFVFVVLMNEEIGSKPIAIFNKIKTNFYVFIVNCPLAIFRSIDTFLYCRIICEAKLSCMHACIVVLYFRYAYVHASIFSNLFHLCLGALTLCTASNFSCSYLISLFEFHRKADYVDFGWIVAKLHIHVLVRVTHREFLS